jgi:hypothetical protein
VDAPRWSWKLLTPTSFSISCAMFDLINSMNVILIQQLQNYNCPLNYLFHFIQQFTITRTMELINSKVKTKKNENKNLFKIWYLLVL